MPPTAPASQNGQRVSRPEVRARDRVLRAVTSSCMAAHDRAPLRSPIHLLEPGLEVHAGHARVRITVVDAAGPRIHGVSLDDPGPAVHREPHGGLEQFLRDAPTSVRKRRLLGSPARSRCSRPVWRQNMHQQPSHAPFSPNNCNRSDQRSGVSGWTSDMVGIVSSRRQVRGTRTCRALLIRRFLRSDDLSNVSRTRPARRWSLFGATYGTSPADDRNACWSRLCDEELLPSRP